MAAQRAVLSPGTAQCSSSLAPKAMAEGSGASVEVRGDELSSSFKRDGSDEGNNEEKGAYWTAPFRDFLAAGRLREDAKLPEPPAGWTRVPTPRGIAAAELIGGCESIEDVHSVLDALETKGKSEWPEEIERQRSEISINEQASVRLPSINCI